jgi:hypothetical protein
MPWEATCDVIRMVVISNHKIVPSVLLYLCRYSAFSFNISSRRRCSNLIKPTMGFGTALQLMNVAVQSQELVHSS